MKFKNLIFKLPNLQTENSLVYYCYFYSSWLAVNSINKTFMYPSSHILLQSSYYFYKSISTYKTETESVQGKTKKIRTEGP